MAYQYKLSWTDIPDNMVEKETYSCDHSMCNRSDCKDCYPDKAHYCHVEGTPNVGATITTASSVTIDKDYFQSIQEEYGSGGETFTKRVQIIETFNSLCNLLQYKNHLYGDSGLTPINVFSKVNAETGLLQRLDDKIARVKNSPELRKNDVADIIGYLVLICVNKGWTNFDEFKD